MAVLAGVETPEFPDVGVGQREEGRDVSAQLSLLFSSFYTTPPSSCTRYGHTHEEEEAVTVRAAAREREKGREKRRK